MRRAASSTRLRVVLGILALVAWGGSTAAAEKKRVGVPRFDGPQEAVIRRAVMKELNQGGYEVVGAKDVDAAAHAAGVELDSNVGFKAVAKELSISAFVTGEVGKKKAKLVVRNGFDGAVSGEGSFAGANPKKVAAEVRDGFSRRLGSAVDRGRAPTGAKKPVVAAAPPPEAEEDEAPGKGDDDDSDGAPAKSSEKSSKASASETASAESAPPEASDTSTADASVAKAAPAPESTGDVGPRAFDLEVGLHGFSRSLTYNEPVSVLRKYNLTLGPAIYLHVVTYPAAFFTSGIAAAIGAEVSVDSAVGVGSDLKPDPNAAGSLKNGGTFKTDIHDFYGGLRARLMLSGHELSAFAGGGEQAFKFSSTGSLSRPDLDIPDTIYRYIRGGVEARLLLSPGFTVNVLGAYRYVTNFGGQIGKTPYFPGLTVGGVDFSAGIGYQVTPSIEIRVSVDLKRYFYDMHSISTDMANGNRAAGGAIDQYIGGMFGVAYVFGGVPEGASSSSSSDEDDSPKKKRKKKKKAADEESASGGEASGGEASGGAPSGGGEASGGGGEKPGKPEKSNEGAKGGSSDE